jgi:formylglycine-generating enzyme required for sulfatase activity
VFDAFPARVVTKYDPERQACVALGEGGDDWDGDDELDEDGNGLGSKYISGKSTLIDDKARVVKGGSWKDLAYYLTPGTRRFLDEKQQTDWLGFRCAMARVGSPTGIGSKKK